MWRRIVEGWRVLMRPAPVVERRWRIHGRLYKSPTSPSSCDIKVLRSVTTLELWKRWQYNDKNKTGHNIHSFFQCCGSRTFWGGSGSADPCLWLMDPDPAIFVIDLQDGCKNKFFNTIFSAYYFLKVHLHNFSKIKSQKESQNIRNQGFPYYFFMMIEGFGSGSIHLTTGSGSGRHKTCGSGGSGSATLVSSWQFVRMLLRRKSKFL